jgi:hypothetical protein
MLRRALIVGLLAGAGFLGVGTRLAMRGVAHIEGRVPAWTTGLTPQRVSTFLLFTPWFLLYGIATSVFTARPRYASDTLEGR